MFSQRSVHLQREGAGKGVTPSHVHGPAPGPVGGGRGGTNSPVKVLSDHVLSVGGVVPPSRREQGVFHSAGPGEVGVGQGAPLAKTRGYPCPPAPRMTGYVAGGTASYLHAGELSCTDSF